MLLSAVPLVAVAALLWLAPGLVWAWLAYPAPDRPPRLAVGAALGLAFQIDLAAPLANTVRITLVSVLCLTAAGLALAVALGLLMRARVVRLPSRTHARRAEARWLILLTLTSVAVCALPLAWWMVPDGWDPSFHALLARAVIARGKLPGWRPYEPIASNYPYGAHVALAELSLLTGLAPDQVFAALLSVVVPALAALQIYALGRRMWRSGPAALGAVAAYGLLGYAGSVDYGAWGGLPNALGLVLALAALEAFFAPGFTARRIAVAGVALSATPLTHHHVALSVGMVFAAYAFALVVFAVARRPVALRPSRAVRRAAWRALQRLGAIAAVALLLASYAFIPYAQRGLRTLGDTAIFADLHEYSGWLLDTNGVALWAVAALGAGLAVRRLWRATTRPAFASHLTALIQRLSPRRGAGQAHLFSAIALVTLFAAFIGGQFVYHAVALALYHQDATALTPTRFLSDMTYFLALEAGPGLAWLWSAPGSWRLPALFARWRRPLARAALVALCVSVAGASLVASQQVGAGKGRLLPGDMSAFAWIRDHTAPDTLVVDLNVDDMRWAPYFTQREAAYTPLPTSEDAAGYPAQKQALVQWIEQALTAWPRRRALAVASAGPAAGVLARPLATITSAPSSAFGRLAYTAGPAHVYLAPSLLSLARAVPAPGVSVWWRSALAGAPGAGWMTPHAALTGWMPGAPAVSGPTGAGWLRMTLVTPVPPGGGVICLAEDGATLYIDGAQVPHGCEGRFVALSQLSAGPGPHLLAVAVSHERRADPWVSIMVLGPPTLPGQ